jgi:threonine dehydrogenase-like Zn-dependent dehydrogenase
MLPLLLLLGGGGFLAHRAVKKRRTSPAVGGSPQGLLLRGKLTPQRAAIHSKLMSSCLSPEKLVKAAQLFGAEGLPRHAEALANKAEVLHKMIHGAKAIVECSRAGDQHAMALAKKIGENARAGDKRAQLSAWLIEQYTKANPPKAAQAA